MCDTVPLMRVETPLPPTVTGFFLGQGLVTMFLLVTTLFFTNITLVTVTNELVSRRRVSSLKVKKEVLYFSPFSLLVTGFSYRTPPWNSSFSYVDYALQ